MPTEVDYGDAIGWNRHRSRSVPGVRSGRGRLRRAGAVMVGCYKNRTQDVSPEPRQDCAAQVDHMDNNARKTVGILAYGSIVTDPGSEIDRLEIGRLDRIDTPFPVEFVRSSSTRAGGPALAPVATGGAPVRGVIIRLSHSVTVSESLDLVYRRETRTIGSGRKYRRRDGLRIECLENFHGIDVVVYAALVPNLENPTPRQLARLAITSAGSAAGRRRLDGISYLIDVKANGVLTPLMGPYEREVLRQTGAGSLDEAWARCQRTR